MLFTAFVSFFLASVSLFAAFVVLLVQTPARGSLATPAWFRGFLMVARLSYFFLTFVVFFLLFPQPGLPEGVLSVSKGNASADAAERFPRRRPAGSPSLSGLVPPARASVPHFCFRKVFKQLSQTSFKPCSNIFQKVVKTVFNTVFNIRFQNSFKPVINKCLNYVFKQIVK